MDPTLAELRELIAFHSPADAMKVATTMWLDPSPGSCVLVFTDADRLPVEFFTVVDGGDIVVSLVGRLVGAVADAAALVVLCDRTGEVPADRPDDELAWIEMVDLCRQHGVTLLDWFVVAGQYAFSLAEHAPVPAQW